MSEQKKVTNLVFRFKEGASALLAAKLFSLAISRMRYFDNLEEPILILFRLPRKRGTGSVSSPFAGNFPAG